MRYCMTYDPKHPEISYYKGYADEIIFEQDFQWPPFFVIQSFAKEFQLIFDIEEISEAFDWLNKIRGNFNIKIRIPSPDYESVIEACRAAGLPFFFKEFPKNEEELIYMVEYWNISDVYITESLGFHLKDLADCLCHDKDNNRNVQIRVFPNVVQSKAKNAISDIQKFFIRPEDLDIYDKGNLIDVCEMWTVPSKQKAFIKIYKEDKKWAGPLSEIIIGFHDDLDNQHFFYPAFVANRLNCCQKCLWHFCNICPEALLQAKYFKEKNLLIKQIDKKEK